MVILCILTSEEVGLTRFSTDWSNQIKSLKKEQEDHDGPISLT